MEDHLETNRALRKLFEAAGHQTTGVFSGEAGLASLKRERADLVILDQLLPGIQGLEVLRRVRADANNLSLPVVIYSAVADANFAEQARVMGATDVWLKGNFSPGALRGKLAEMLDRRERKPPAIAPTIAPSPGSV